MEWDLLKLDEVSDDLRAALLASSCWDGRRRARTVDQNGVGYGASEHDGEVLIDYNPPGRYTFPLAEPANVVWKPVTITERVVLPPVTVAKPCKPWWKFWAKRNR